MKVVYYPQVVPNNRLTISLLAILFDQVILPGAYLPLDKLDTEEIQELIRIIEVADAERHETSVELLLPLHFALEYGELSEVFVGTGEAGHMGLLEPGAENLTTKIEELYYGPPEPNFTPVPAMGFNIGVGKEQINSPATFSYPANAYIYAQANKLPLITDKSTMPFPAAEKLSLSEEGIANELSLSVLSAAMPRIRALTARELIEIRSAMKMDINSFHSAMHDYSSKVIELCKLGLSQADYELAVEFIIKTEILPRIEHIKSEIETPGKILRKGAINLSIEAPFLTATALLMPSPGSLIPILGAGAKAAHDMLRAMKNNREMIASSGLGLAIKIPQQYR